MARGAVACESAGFTSDKGEAKNFEDGRWSHSEEREGPPCTVLEQAESLYATDNIKEKQERENISIAKSQYATFDIKVKQEKVNIERVSRACAAPQARSDGERAVQGQWRRASCMHPTKREAFDIVYKLQGEFLRALAAGLDTHVRVQQGARLARARGLLSGRTAKRIGYVEACFNVVRHVTIFSASQLLWEVEEQLMLPSGRAGKSGRRHYSVAVHEEDEKVLQTEKLAVKTEKENLRQDSVVNALKADVKSLQDMVKLLQAEMHAELAVIKAAAERAQAERLELEAAKHAAELAAAKEEQNKLSAELAAAKADAVRAQALHVELAVAMVQVLAQAAEAAEVQVFAQAAELAAAKAAAKKAAEAIQELEAAKAKASKLAAEAQAAQKAAENDLADVKGQVASIREEMAAASSQKAEQKGLSKKAAEQQDEDDEMDVKFLQEQVRAAALLAEFESPHDPVARHAGSCALQMERRVVHKEAQQTRPRCSCCGRGHLTGDCPQRPRRSLCGKNHYTGDYPLCGGDGRWSGD